MPRKIYACLFWICTLFISSVALAQEKITEKKVEMADGLRANGKIYVVVAVVVTILAGILFYLISLDRKISRIEKEK